MIGIPYAIGAAIIYVKSLYNYQSHKIAIDNLLDVDNYQEQNIKNVMLTLAIIVFLTLILIWLPNLDKILMYLTS